MATAAAPPPWEDPDRPMTAQEEELYKAMEEQLAENGVIAALSAQLRVHILEAMYVPDEAARKATRTADAARRRRGASSR